MVVITRIIYSLEFFFCFCYEQEETLLDKFSRKWEKNLPESSARGRNENGVD